jgi:mRNA-degrading endonuclease RelE of RelBE toxin-antitoxin system
MGCYDSLRDSWSQNSCRIFHNGTFNAGLQHIITEPESGKSLKDELEGPKSYRISGFRIISRISSKQAIDIVAVGPRKTIYEETYRIIRKEANQ